MTSRQDWYLRPRTQPEHQGRSEPVYASETLHESERRIQWIRAMRAFFRRFTRAG